MKFDGSSDVSIILSNRHNCLHPLQVFQFGQISLLLKSCIYSILQKKCGKWLSSGYDSCSIKIQANCIYVNKLLYGQVVDLSCSTPNLPVCLRVHLFLILAYCIVNWHKLSGRHLPNFSWHSTIIIKGVLNNLSVKLFVNQTNLVIPHIRDGNSAAVINNTKTAFTDYARKLQEKWHHKLNSLLPPYARRQLMLSSWNKKRWCLSRKKRALSSPLETLERYINCSKSHRSRS